MKHILESCLVTLLFLGFGWAQDTTQRQMEKPGQPEMHEHMRAMHEQMMKSLQADLDNMRANLQKMRGQLAGIKDKGAREQSQLNIAMWQSLIDSMDKHLQLMKNMGGPGMHGHHDHEHRHGAMPTPSPQQ